MPPLRKRGYPHPTRYRPDKKKANPLRLAFFLSINDLPELDVERAMGIEHVDLTTPNVSNLPATY